MTKTRPERTQPASHSLPPEETRERFLDAAERLLIQHGYARVTTRRLGEEAGANHGLIHYYFGSMEELFIQVLERFTERLVARQRTMYTSPMPFVERWREAMRYLDEDRPYQKIWWELQAMSWNHPEFRFRIAGVHEAWRETMREAVREALSRYRIEGPVMELEAWITLIVTVNEGIILERLSGVTAGHDALLEGIDRWLSSLEEAAHPDPGSKVRTRRKS